jgi:LuxR family quorum-sensing system transcriptional regulator CciR
VRWLSDLFAEAAEACADLRRLGALLGEVTLELGFDHFALLDHSSLSKPSGALIRIDNYPESWAREIAERGYGSEDPVHRASRRTNAGFAWTEVGSLIALEPLHRTILERSKYHGLGGGFTIPANVPGEPGASCSFAVRTGRALPRSSLRCAELIGIRALYAARRMRGRTRRAQRPRLSRREVQCVKLVALGKTDWEIARILGLSVHTTRQYVKRARSAYATVSRTQLALYALRDQWIGFEDAIPPNG